MTPPRNPAFSALLALGLTAAVTLLPLGLRAAEEQPWSVETTLYGLAASMSGDVTVKGVDAALDVGFDQVWDHLEFGAMGKVRVGYDRWALTTDVVYMGLQASKNSFTMEVDEWVVEPTVSCRVARGFELLAGVRYNNVSGELRGPGLLAQPRVPTGTQDWWDPIVGANLRLPLGGRFTLNVRGDVGGFGVGSDVTWQAFPSVEWRVAKPVSLQAGYRWVATDYETGSGRNRFRYDVLTQGPQVGLSLRF